MWEKNVRENGWYICMTSSFCCTAEITTACKLNILQKKKKSSVAAAVAQVTAVAWIQSLAQECSYAMDAAIKLKKKIIKC